MKSLLSLIFFLFILNISFSQEKKTYQISRCEIAPKIDGILNDAVWEKSEIATNFIQFRPDTGILDPQKKRTDVKMTYDDDAIYIAAYLYDNPEDILTQFTQRDNFGQSDFFGIIFNPNNDAQNNTEFFVFSSGTQADAVESPNNGEDFGWNAVWESSVKMEPNGWIVEIKIPYRALRFTQQENPTWGIQFHRHFRKTRVQSTWNPIDVTKGTIGFYNGELKGLKNITPPTRLNFYPYASHLVSDFDHKTKSEFTAGLDIKYGITENITLDATLIPDFSQAGFDNVELNLGPFEQQFREQRQFFTEGIDIFNKGNLFYSRRIGNLPSTVPNTAKNEEILNYPDKVQLLNAVKVSGRTKKSLGIGFFNAITKKTNVDILNTNNNSIRTETVEPLSNYNIMVLDQQFNKNSSVTLINTNVTRNGDFRDANVTALLLDLANKNNTYGAIGEIKMSSFNDSNQETGFSSAIGFGKNGGRFRYNFSHYYAEENYNPNDLGILFRNNYNNVETELSYRSFKPTKKLNNYFIGFSAEYNRLKKPNAYTGLKLNTIFRATTKKLHSFGCRIKINPGKYYDYFEPRDNFNSFFTTKNYYENNFWISSNYNTFFSIDTELGYGTLLDTSFNYHNTYFSISPRFKFNSKFLLVLELDHANIKGEQGYINNQAIDNKILFGQRNRKDIETSISGSYNFNPFNALTLSFRNYLSTVKYNYNLFILQSNGALKESRIYNKYNIGQESNFNPDINFNTWNLDLSYTWQFAPGSQLTALFRNQIFNFSNNAQDNYLTSTQNLFNQEMRNTFSLRMVYFIDYNNLKKVLKSKTG